jgi:LysR family pca operon transcriptional activator
MAEPHDIADLAFEHLYSEPLVAVVRSGHPLLAGGGVDLRSISDYELLMPPPMASPFRPWRWKPCRAPLRETTCDTDAVWFTSQGVVERDVTDGHLVQLPVDLLETLGPVGLIRIDQPLNAGASVLVETVRLLTARAAPGVT